MYVGKQAAKDTKISRDLSFPGRHYGLSTNFMNIYQLQDYAELQEIKQAAAEYRVHISEMPAPRHVFLESLRTTCGWATDVTDIMLSLIEGSTGPLPDYAKKEIDTFTGKIAQEYFLQWELMTCDCYQKLLTHKYAMSQSKRVGARETEDKASTKERTEDVED